MTLINRPIPPPCMDKQEETRIFLENVPWIERFVNITVARDSRLPRHREDLLSEARCGMLHAIRKYDETKGKLSTYSTIWMRAYMQSYIARSVNATHNCRYGQPDDRASFGEWNEPTSPPPTIDETEKHLAELKNRLVAVLGTKRGEGWFQRLRGKTWQEFADEEGVSRQCMEQRFKRFSRQAHEVLDAFNKDMVA